MKIVLLTVSLAISEIIAVRSKRSMGEEPISIKDAPYFVSITHSGRFVCGAALITVQHVLSAAYELDPFAKNPSEVKMLSSTDQRMTGANNHTIEKIRIHPDFKIGVFPTDRQSNIAVITLKSPIVKSDVLKPIQWQTEMLGDGGPAELIAFNSDSLNTGDPLHKLPITMEWIETCRQYCLDPNTWLGFLCARRYTEHGMSDNDAGSPLVRDGQLAGIASVVKRYVGRVDVFTSVYVHLDFIIQETECSNSLCVIA